MNSARSPSAPSRAIALVDHRFAEDAYAVRDTVLPSLTVVAYGGDAPGRPDRAGRRQVGRVHQRGDRRPTTWRCSARPPAAPASRRSPCTSTATSCRSTTRSAATRSGCAPDDVVACTAPLAFTFGLGMLVVFPLRAGACALLTEAGHARAARRNRRRATASPCWRPRRPRTGRYVRDGLERQARRAARRPCPRASTSPQDIWQRLRDEHRPEGHRRHRRHRAAAHLHLRRGRRHPARRDRQAGARLPRRHPRPGRRASSAPASRAGSA